MTLPADARGRRGGSAARLAAAAGVKYPKGKNGAGKGKKGTTLSTHKKEADGCERGCPSCSAAAPFTHSLSSRHWIKK